MTHMTDNKNCAGWTVMIVDDQFDNVTVAQTVLEFLGAKVHVARNGREGLTLLEQVKPTAILLDLSMPVLNGWEMFAQLRDRADMKHVPIIAVTAHAMDGDRHRVLEAGFDDYISKPYDIHVLAERIQAALDRKQRVNHG